MVEAGSRSAIVGIQALVARKAGYSVAAECIRVQAKAEAQDPSLRSSDVVRLHHDAWPWFQGALGEIRVGQLLAALGPKWRVLHSVPMGSNDTDVDHVLVGHGRLRVNTKHHAGASIWVGDVVLMVNGDKTRHLSRARDENRKVAHRLVAEVGFPVVVHSAIVIVGERSLKDIGDAESREVTVLSSAQLVPWLTSHRATSSVAQLDLIRLAAEEPDTWHVDPHQAENLRVMQRFLRLQEAVGQSQSRPAAPALGERLARARAVPPRSSSALTRSTRSLAGRPKRTPAQKKRSDGRAKQLAEAIVALALLGIVLVMTSNGTWAPFVSGVISLLTSPP